MQILLQVIAESVFLLARLPHAVKIVFQVNRIRAIRWPDEGTSQLPPFDYIGPVLWNIEQNQQSLPKLACCQ